MDEHSGPNPRESAGNINERTGNAGDAYTTSASAGGGTSSGVSRSDGRPRGRYHGCLIVFLCLFGGLGAVALLFSFGILHIMFSADWLQDGEKSSSVREEVVAAGTDQRKIAVVSVKGMIVSRDKLNAASAQAIGRQLKHAREDPLATAVILDMNTPGGEVTASDEIYHAVKRLRASGKPVVTCMHGMGASGGYLIAAGSDYIVANRLTLTGSIGVLMGTLNYSDFLEEHHLKMEIYKSGAMKDSLNGARDRTTAEKKHIESLISSTFEEFARIVAENRSDYADWKDVEQAPFGDGRVLTGEKAKEFGLVDECGYFKDAVEKARELAGAPHASVVRYRPKLGLTDLFFSMRSGIGGAALQMLPPEQRLLKPGHLYYLLPTAVE